MEGKIRLKGVALHPAKKGNYVEVEIDLGTSGDFFIALENEPPDVTLVRVTREQELIAEANSYRLRLDGAERHAEHLRRELKAVTAEDSEFMRSLGKIVADELFSYITARIVGKED